MHLMIEATHGDPRLLFGRDSHYVQYLRSMTSLAGMTPISEPVVKDTPGGRTGFLILAESHVSIHAFHEKRAAYIDLFTCKPLPVPPQKLVDLTKRMFAFQSDKFLVIERGLEFV